jgi:rhamnose transport system substrate-binding protein
MSSPSPLSEAAVDRRFAITHEVVLATVLAVEIAVFAAIGRNFWSWTNAFEITRLLVEVGLLALAMTPVIITGGIDLSVGALMGLSAVLFGMMWDPQHANLPMYVAVPCTLAVGFIAGCMNALLITKLRLPPLIVTLGTFSLFRGLGEGLTGGTTSFNVPENFQFLGQGYLLGGIPTQLPIFVAIAIGFWIMLQRTTVGRGLYAIGFSADGARHAGIPVERRLNLVYILSGIVASLAAIIYVSHVGQAKSDAGMGYELTAITAVVLGGTSIFGGRGTIQGTVLGLFAITILQNGLQLAALPGYLAGILMGGLLLVTISMERLGVRGAFGGRSAGTTSEEFEVKNSQVFALSFVILLAAAIVAGSNWLLLRDLHLSSSGSPTVSAPSTNNGTSAVEKPNDPSNSSSQKLTASGAENVTPPDAGKMEQPSNGGPAKNKKIRIGMMPKSLGNAYFIACRKGAEQAASELGVELDWQGPTDPDPAKQSQIVDTWITSGVDVIAVAVENRDAISSVLKKAREHGIKVITWDSDADTAARDFFVNQATPQGIGYTLMDHAARLMDGKGEFAIIVGSITAANMIEWQKYIKERMADKYPNIKLKDVRPCDDKQGIAMSEANTMINAYPDLKLIMAICSPGVPGAAEAVKQSGRSDVKVIGLGLPNDNKPYIHEGVTDCIVLWNTMDLGYLTVYAAEKIANGDLKAGDTSLTAGHLGKFEIQGDNILLGTPFTFTKENIDKFDF